MPIEYKFQSSAPRKTYSLIAYRFMSISGVIAFGVMALFFLLPIVQVLVGLEAPNTATLCIAPLFAGLFLSLIVSALFSAHIRLVTSPAGIEYYQVGYSICTSWDNIQGFGQVPYGRTKVLGLVLHQPALQTNKYLKWMTPVRKQLGLDIPIDPFLGRWQNNELEQDLERYLPHLFVE